ncbi:hypothetical protein EYZ11_006634 [Aspergillus tanneri]|uniref:DUF7702 domain-containing protein n=1 Tax=Aspergillus tanneri TaxID=1220188 RepID=A0A4S3JF96_9EURO|nr:uncharacterized protein ATNIH1004_008090 [Aspergillus tanneri]KAA8643894.1 hypothetical protein ATNIH1004_008090 [Aspergillus tanneri]THC93882.1 hypothetical protein EYZ11_006634 [Aspergillus tanneri]
MFALRDAIYLIELAFYAPIVPAILFIILLHGNKYPYTWRPVVIPLIILSGLRIAAAGLGLAAIDPAKSNLLTTATVLDTIGLAPVLCLLIGLLIRANAPVYKGLPLWVFIPLQMITIPATVMTAYGGRDLYTSRDSQAQDLRLMRAGIILFIALFAGTVLLSVITMLKVRVKLYRSERAAVVCALLCVPFMSVRLAFSAGSLFSGERSVLNPMSEDETSIWLHFLMVIVMEYIVTLSATAVALTARKVVVLTPGRVDPLKDEEI